MTAAQRYTFVIVCQVIGAADKGAAQSFLDEWYEQVRAKHPAGEVRVLNAYIVPADEYEPDEPLP